MPSSNEKEIKSFEIKAIGVNDDEGTVEAIVSVFGIIDYYQDIIHPGAFTKTISERGNSFRVLNSHDTSSVLSSIGQVVEIRELKKSELPSDVKEKFPKANGGLYVKVKFLLSTPEGAGVYQRIKEGIITEWSIGYSPHDYDFSTVKSEDGTITVRNIRTVKLWELSPVIFGANQATTTIGVKSGQVEEKSPTIDEEYEKFLQLEKKKAELIERAKKLIINLENSHEN